MIQDFMTYDGDGGVDCDLCIAGAGAAGIALARHLMNERLKVVVLESGGLDYDEATQALYSGQNVGLPYFDLAATRLRFFGGSTNHWGGMCSRFDPIDFKKRSWVAGSGWPIGYQDVEPFFPEAHDILDLGSYDWNLESAAPDDARFLALDSRLLAPKLWRYSMPPTALGQKYRAELEASGTIEVWLHANLVDIETGADGARVRSFLVKSLDGKATRVRASAFVLALGGIENARMLLSADQTVRGGLGNQNDLVGRHFMEHIGVVSGAAVGVSDWVDSYLDLFKGEEQVRCAIRPSPAQQEELNILNSMAMFGDVSLVRAQSEGYAALVTFRNALEEGRLPDELGQEIWNIISDIPGVVAGMAEKVDPTTYITIEGEQVPNPDSRVTLSDERDALGLRRPVLDWRLEPIDKITIRELTQLIGLELGRLEVGRVRLDDWLVEDDTSWPDNLVGANHHMGTTRMADDPKKGVVDADSKVFGTDNLFVAGSSVFTTGGCSNPTLNLVALSLRLAGHLRQRLA